MLDRAVDENGEREYQSGLRMQTCARHTIRVASKAFSALVRTSQQGHGETPPPRHSMPLSGDGWTTKKTFPPSTLSLHHPYTGYSEYLPLLPFLPGLPSMNPPPSSPLPLPFLSPSSPLPLPFDTRDRLYPPSLHHPDPVSTLPPYEHQSLRVPQPATALAYRTRVPSSHAPRVRSPSHRTTCDHCGRWIDTCALSVPEVGGDKGGEKGKREGDTCISM